MEQSYSGSLISLAAALAEACSGKKNKHGVPAACVTSENTGSKKKSPSGWSRRKKLGIIFDKHSAGNYFALIGSSRLRNERNKK